MGIAAQNGLTNIVECLIAAGADVNAVSKSGSSPLHAAAQRGHFDVVKKLLAAGADSEAVDIQGLTPLQVPIESGNTLSIVEALTKARADASTLLYTTQDLRVQERVSQEPTPGIEVPLDSSSVQNDFQKTGAHRMISKVSSNISNLGSSANLVKASTREAQWGLEHLMGD